LAEDSRGIIIEVQNNGVLEAVTESGAEILPAEKYVKG